MNERTPPGPSDARDGAPDGDARASRAGGPGEARRDGDRASFLARSWRSHPWRTGLAGALLVLVVAVGVCEALGWPFLAAPAQRVLARTLERRVAFGEGADAPARLRIHLLGGIRIDAPFIEIGSPSWSREPHMLRARDASLRLGYMDLWRARRGEPLRIRSLRASELDGHIERLADGRASWQFGSTVPKPETDAAAWRVPRFDRLRVREGTLAYDDAVLGTDLRARFSLRDRSPQRGNAPQAPASRTELAAASAAASAVGAGSVPPAAAAASAPTEFRFDATGHYRRQPMNVEFASNGVLDVIAEDAARIAWPVRLRASVGRAALSFEGTATDVLRLTALKGRFDVHGPSLAAVGDPLGVTLPTTGAFRASGLLAKQGEVWNTVVDGATVGSSRLAGAFSYDAGRRVPLLSGRLRGTRLLLADLGPAVGAPPGGAARAAAARASSAASAPRAAQANAPTKASTSAPTRGPANARKTAQANPPNKNANAKAAAPARAQPADAAARRRVLPDRPFDLPSLRAMDANVLVDIDDLDLGTDILEPLRPARTHLVLSGGVLELRDLDARTADGSLAGLVRLDGRGAKALWSASLRWRDVRLERWLHLARRGDSPPYIAGRLDGQAEVTGQGRSTADILGSLRGSVRMHLENGRISHLAVEAAGLDVAQALGVLVKGDDSLPISCTVADLVADRGVLRPRVLVLDTRDSTVWADGSLSLADESMDLRLLVSPKDFSPLALRAPVRVRGSFADPAVSIEARSLAARVGAAAALALVNPLAAVIPFFDTGSSDEARRGAQACRALAARLSARQSAADARAAAR